MGGFLGFGVFGVGFHYLVDFGVVWVVASFIGDLMTAGVLVCFMCLWVCLLMEG